MGFGQARRRSLRKSVLGACSETFSILPALSKAAKCKGGEGVAKVSSEQQESTTSRCFRSHLGENNGGKNKTTSSSLEAPDDAWNAQLELSTSLGGGELP